MPTDAEIAFLTARLDEDEEYAKQLLTNPALSDISGMLGLSRRLLGEVEAARALIAEYRRALEKAPGNLPLLNTLRRLISGRAAVYSDHAEYDPEWSATP